MRSTHPRFKTLACDFSGSIGTVRLARPAKRNALSDAMIEELREALGALPEHVRAVILDGEGESFCAGLDLSEVKDCDAEAGMHRSQAWHAAFEKIQFGRVPVIAVLHGAVVGGGLELASAAHIRVADSTAYFALPEGTRGLFVGGGGAVRVSRLIGFSRMTDMMLTGRVYTADEALGSGLVHYLTPLGEAFGKAMKLADKIGTNAPLSNYAIMRALPSIADQTMAHGFLTESLMAAITQSAPDAKARLNEFLVNKANKVKTSS